MDLNATEHILFAGWAVVWLLTPLIGWMLAKNWPGLGPATRRAILAICVLSLALAGCTIFAPWALRGFWANAINLGLAYLALSTLLWLAFRKCRKWLAVLAPLAIHAVLGIQIFVCLVFANNQIPFHQMDLGHGLVARIYRKGFMGSSFDEAVLVLRPRGLPLMEHRFYAREIEYWECTETSAKLVETTAGETVQIVCGTQVLNIVPVP